MLFLQIPPHLLLPARPQRHPGHVPGGGGRGQGHRLKATAEGKVEQGKQGGGQAGGRGQDLEKHNGGDGGEDAGDAEDSQEQSLKKTIFALIAL